MSGTDDMDCFALTNTVFAASAREVPCEKKQTNKQTKLLQVCCFCFVLILFLHLFSLTQGQGPYR